MTPRIRILASGLLFLAVFGLYLRGLSPAFHPDDSAETITAGVTLSMQHPPGYPLHTVLARLAAVAMPGGAPFRVNLVAALAGAASALAFAWVLAGIRRELGNPGPPGPDWADLAGGLLLSANGAVWFQASIAKGGLYTLNLALTAGFLLALLSWRRRPALSALGMAGLLFGLGMANHWTSQVVLLPGAALLALPGLEGLRRPGFRRAPLRALGAALGLALAGFSLYLVLALRDQVG